MAILLERASQEFYRQLIPQSQDTAVCEFLSGLIREEEFHQQQLQNLVDTETDLLTMAVPVKEVADYVKAMHVPPSLNYKQAVRLAMDKERSSQMLYAVLAGLMTNNMLAQLFLRLSAQEKGHRSFFEKEYHRILLSEN